jgi:hypothetical protein
LREDRKSPAHGQRDAIDPERTSSARAERTHRDRRNSDEAANSDGLDLARIHRLLWNALDDEAAEFRQLVAERQEVLEGR